MSLAEVVASGERRSVAIGPRLVLVDQRLGPRSFAGSASGYTIAMHMTESAMSRRTTLIAASLLAALARATSAQGATPDPRIMRISVEPLAGGARVLRGYTNGNVLAVPTGNGTLLVDGQSATRVAELDSVLRALSLGGVRWVVTTHYHADHLDGNAHWRAAGAEILAHESVSRQAVKDTTIDDWKWHRTPAAAAAMPTRYVADSTQLVFGADTIILLHVPRAHTDGDLLVWVPGRNLLHTGDIVEREAFPFLDWWAGGTLDGMIAAVDRILSLVTDETIIVPGHGQTTTRSGVIAYRAMLAAARDRIVASVRANKALEEILRASPLAEYAADNGGTNALQRFTALLYWGLSRHIAPAQ